LKIISLEYKEGVPDLVKHGGPPFYIEIELDNSELPQDTSWRSDGNQIWKSKLSTLEVLPDSVQRLGGWTHSAQLFWHDRHDAIKAFEALKRLQ